MEENSPAQQSPVQPIPTTSAEQSIKKSFPKNALLLGFGIIFFVILSGFGYYILQAKKTTPVSPSLTPMSLSPSPIPDPTANWKTYINNQYGYSLRYPADTTITEKTVDGWKGSPAKITPATQTIFVYRGGKLIINPDPFPQDFTSILITKDVRVAGKTVQKWYLNANTALITQIISPLGDGIEFDFALPSENHDAIDQIFDQILSTFKFTDQNQVITTGISGKITIGPECPNVPISPSDHQCDDKPYKATVAVKSADQTITQFTSNDDGTFNVSLPPGIYTLVPQSNSIYPRGISQTVTVTQGGKLTTEG